MQVAKIHAHLIIIREPNSLQIAGNHFSISSEIKGVHGSKC